MRSRSAGNSNSKEEAHLGDSKYDSLRCLRNNICSCSEKACVPFIFGSGGMYGHNSFGTSAKKTKAGHLNTISRTFGCGCSLLKTDLYSENDVEIQFLSVYYSVALRF